MSRRRKTEEGNEADVDMTPMLDIVFILLIFFIVTTSFVKELGLEVTKPKSNSTQSNNDPSIVVSISDTGIVSFNGKRVDIERLPARIENFLAANITSTAIILPSSDTRHEDVVLVIDQIKQFDQLTIAFGKSKS
ncbi:biopolymer transporter ExbD [Thalassotalea sp. M1531]|uniref:Biopolymer transporter ExbD n=1 Tax=Thalassotalea algicola TaxID=2716224 RepID=A0A7Y0LF01_9GAMM|nr:biopolymer transporter ExbD [Thalassotalea algicola]NMP33328.1 biopolymer transporter ExbD [Thalassotalea algicola]